MANTDNDVLLLESMLGTADSKKAVLKFAVDNNLPIHFPQSIHY